LEVISRTVNDPNATCGQIAAAGAMGVATNVHIVGPGGSNVNGNYGISPTQYTLDNATVGDYAIGQGSSTPSGYDATPIFCNGGSRSVGSINAAVTQDNTTTVYAAFVRRGNLNMYAKGISVAPALMTCNNLTSGGPTGLGSGVIRSLDGLGVNVSLSGPENTGSHALNKLLSNTKSGTYGVSVNSVPSGYLGDSLIYCYQDLANQWVKTTTAPSVVLMGNETKSVYVGAEAEPRGDLQVVAKAVNDSQSSCAQVRNAVAMPVGMKMEIYNAPENNGIYTMPFTKTATYQGNYSLRIYGPASGGWPVGYEQSNYIYCDEDTRSSSPITVQVAKNQTKTVYVAFVARANLRLYAKGVDNASTISCADLTSGGGTGVGNGVVASLNGQVGVTLTGPENAGSYTLNQQFLNTKQGSYSVTVTSVPAGYLMGNMVYCYGANGSYARSTGVPSFTVLGWDTFDYYVGVEVVPKGNLKIYGKEVTDAGTISCDNLTSGGSGVVRSLNGQGVIIGVSGPENGGSYSLDREISNTLQGSYALSVNSVPAGFVTSPMVFCSRTGTGSFTRGTGTPTVSVLKNTNTEVYVGLVSTPSAPSLSGPACTPLVQPSWTWSQGANTTDANLYRSWLGQLLCSGSATCSLTLAGAGSFHPATPFTTGSYSLQVAARRGVVEGPKSSVSTIGVDLIAPDVPTPNIVCNANGEVDLSWGAVSDIGCGGLAGAPYQAQISNDDTFASGVWNSGSISQRLFSANGYAEGTRIYGRVRATDSLTHTSAWSGVLSCVIPTVGAPVCSNIVTNPISPRPGGSLLSGVSMQAQAQVGADLASGYFFVDINGNGVRDGGESLGGACNLAGQTCSVANVNLPLSDGNLPIVGLITDSLDKTGTCTAPFCIDSAAPANPSGVGVACNYVDTVGGVDRFSVDLDWNSQSDTGCAGMSTLGAYRSELSRDSGFSSLVSGWNSDWTNTVGQSTLPGNYVTGSNVTVWARVQGRDAAGNTSGYSPTVSVSCSAPSSTGNLRVYGKEVGSMSATCDQVVNATGEAITPQVQIGGTTYGLPVVGPMDNVPVGNYSVAVSNSGIYTNGSYIYCVNGNRTTSPPSAPVTANATTNVYIGFVPVGTGNLRVYGHSIPSQAVDCSTVRAGSAVNGPQVLVQGDEYLLPLQGALDGILAGNYSVAVSNPGSYLPDTYKYCDGESAGAGSTNPINVNVVTGETKNVHIGFVAEAMVCTAKEIYADDEGNTPGSYNLVTLLNGSSVIAPNSNVVFTIRYRNDSSVAATTIVRDVLAANLVYVDGDAGCSYASGLVSCNTSNTPAGGSGWKSFRVRVVGSSGGVSNTATLAGGSSCTSPTVPLSSALALVGSCSNGGDSMTYTWTPPDLGGGTVSVYQLQMSTSDATNPDGSLYNPDLVNETALGGNLTSYTKDGLPVPPAGSSTPYYAVIRYQSGGVFSSWSSVNTSECNNPSCPRTADPVVTLDCSDPTKPVATIQGINGVNYYHDQNQVTQGWFSNTDPGVKKCVFWNAATSSWTLCANAGSNRNWTDAWDNPVLVNPWDGPGTNGARTFWGGVEHFDPEGGFWGPISPAGHLYGTQGSALIPNQTFYYRAQAQGSCPSYPVAVSCPKSVYGKIFDSSDIQDDSQVCTGANVVAAVGITGVSFSIQPISGSGTVYNSVISGAGGLYSQELDLSNLPVTYQLFNFNLPAGYSWRASCPGNTATFATTGDPSVELNFAYRRVFGGWWQVIGGDAYGGGGIVSEIPETCTGGVCEPFLVRALDNQAGLPKFKAGSLDIGNSPVAFASAAGANTAQGANVNDGPAQDRRYNYDFFLANARSYPKTNITGITGKPVYSPPVGQDFQIYYLPGNGAAQYDINFSVLSNEKMIFFVDGDVSVLGNVDVEEGGLLAVIASGTITFDSPVANAEGFWIADVINIASSGDTATEVKFHGEGLFAGISNIILNRNLGDTNNTSPAEEFQFRPDLLINAPDALKIRDSLWREVAP